MITIKIPEFKYKQQIVLCNIEQQFEIGKTHGIIGLNGAGKTTFFNVLSGYLKHENCSTHFNGNRIQRNQISHIDTDPFFYRKLTAGEFLNVFESKSNTYDEKRLSDLLKIDLNQLIEEYSTGMKKKLLLLSQIKQDKDIYILDEPFNGLDLETNKILEVLIQILNEKSKTVFISSHILEPLLNVCHQIFLLKDQTIKKNYSQNEFTLIDKELFGEYTQTVKEELRQIL
ncbi:MAG: ATP-binding cassette domain-containing protein [Sphingobacteriaceae bacterium]|jgi:ABC-2 type transport system ATP-binding protein